MIEKWMKMGKRSSKSHAHKKLGSPDKNLFAYLRDSFPADESNDSGLGCDASILFADSNLIARTSAESDFDNSCDSTNLSVFARRENFSSNSTSLPLMPTNYGRERLQIETNFGTSLNDKMHIQAMDSTNRPRIASVFSVSEPLAKRRRVATSDDYSSSSSSSSSLPCSRQNGLQNLLKPALNVKPHVIGGGVLTEATVCHNALSKRSDSVNCQVSSVDDGHHEHRLPWSSRENFVHTQKSGNGDEGGGCDRIAALLAVATQPSVGPAGRKKLPKKPSLHVCFPPRSKELKAELSILIQPEEQHRARYMTEGSRGSIKDENGNGFPKIKLCGYKQPVTVQVFIGSDTGKVQPHLFYQACKVTGKNCTPCTERMIEGTSVIEITLLPENDMTVSCDCIGILKERNVDVEQRLPYFGLARCKKRSTKCRMVFRVNIQLPNGNIETLQIASSQILCTQSPGVPEICKKSLTECSAKGGTELFIIGKNFQKDTKILFQELSDGDDTTGTCERKLAWEQMVDPEKEFLHQSHLICCVPPYRDGGIVFPVKVYLSVLSGGKSSEPHTFTYTPSHSVSNVNHFSGCHSEFRLRSSHEPMGFCKSEMMSPELTSTVNCGSPMMPASMLNSQQTMLASSCPTSPADVMPLAMHLISPSHAHQATPPTSPSSSASSSHQFPMPMMNSDVERNHMHQLQQHQQQQLGSACTSVLLAIAEASQVSSSSVSPMSASSFSSVASLSPPQHATNVDLVGHDVDLMKRIDQLACDMTAVQEARCSPPRVSEVINLSQPADRSSPTTQSCASAAAHTQVAMASEVLHNCESIFSDGTSSMQCREIGCSRATSADLQIGPTVSLASIVSAMVTSAAASEVSANMFAMNQTTGANDLRQNEVSTMSTITSIHQMDVLRNDIIDVKPSLPSQLDGIHVCPQQLPPTLPSETNEAIHEASISFDIHCCSGVSPSVASIVSCVSTSPSLSGKAIVHPLQQQVTSASDLTEVKLCDAAAAAAITSTAPTAASTSEQQAVKSDKTGAQPDMMTLAFSQLSDADLLSMINPSAFDSV